MDRQKLVGTALILTALILTALILTALTLTALILDELVDGPAEAGFPARPQAMLFSLDGIVIETS